MGMALERAVQLAQRERRLARRRSRNSAPAAYSAGAAWPLDSTKRSRAGSSTVRGPDIQFRAIEAGQQIGAGQRAAGMAGAGMKDRGDGMAADEARRLGQLCVQASGSACGRGGRHRLELRVMVLLRRLWPAARAASRSA